MDGISNKWFFKKVAKLHYSLPPEPGAHTPPVHQRIIICVAAAVAHHPAAMRVGARDMPNAASPCLQLACFQAANKLLPVAQWSVFITKKKPTRHFEQHADPPKRSSLNDVSINRDKRMDISVKSMKLKQEWKFDSSIEIICLPVYPSRYDEQKNCDLQDSRFFCR
jgi:hypothetical protein